MLDVITKRLYPEIALKHKTTANKVERSICHAIDTAWNEQMAKTMSMLYNYHEKDKPTNLQLLSMIVDKIILENLFTNIILYKDSINEENLKKLLKKQFEKEFNINNFDIDTLKVIMISFISCYIDTLQKEKESQ